MHSQSLLVLIPQVLSTEAVADDNAVVVDGSFISEEKRRAFMVELYCNEVCDI